MGEIGASGAGGDGGGNAGAGEGGIAFIATAVYPGEEGQTGMYVQSYVPSPLSFMSTGLPSAVTVGFGQSPADACYAALYGAFRPHTRLAEQVGAGASEQEEWSR